MNSARQVRARLLGDPADDFLGGQPPEVDLEVEKRLVGFLVTGADRGLFRSAHDCSHGGLGVALAEVAMGGPYQEHGYGLDVDLTAYGSQLTAHEILFSESHGRAVITCPADRAAAVQALAGELSTPCYRVGTVGQQDGRFSVTLRDGRIEESVTKLRDVYFSAIPRRMGD